MDTRRKIGIVYNYNDKWIGGTYYINSIIALLKEKSDLFELFIISNNKKNKINDLPFVYFNYSLFDRIINLIRRIYPKIVDIYLKTLGKRNIKRLMFFDFIFPVVQVNFYFDKLTDEKKIYWIADLQENYFPVFFQKQDILNRIVLQIEAAYSRCKLVLSSQSAKNDFLRLYPKKYCTIKIIPFISSLYFENNYFISFKEIENKYNLKEKYFICSNQFWKHKNHSVIVEAVSILKKENINVNVYFTGKEYDYRDSEYTINLKKRVKELSLKDNIHFLGFIPRKDQITLIKYAQAVIQPSFFEGWNTTIEDAKFLKKEIIASNISVHNEQIKEKKYLFDPVNADDLANKIKEIYSRDTKIIDYFYQEEYLNYQNKIIDLFSNDICLGNK